MFINKLRIYISNKNLRRLIFSLYVFISIIFMIVLYYIGKEEIDKNKRYAQTEEIIGDKLYQCLTTLNQLDKLKGVLSKNRLNDKYLEQLKDKVDILRTTILSFADYYKNRENVSLLPINDLEFKTALLLSIITSLQEDFKTADFAEREIIFSPALEEFHTTQNRIHFIVLGLIENELNFLDSWRRKNSFFVNKIQNSIALYFLLTIIFSVCASLLFAWILKSSLNLLRKGTGEISRGNLKYRFKEISKDEVGNVMNDFNYMVERLSLQQEELENKANELIKANKHKDQFLANMSHELRTPLNAVIGFSDIILARADKLAPEKMANYAKKIIDASEHLLTLISDLLDVAKFDVDMLEGDFEKIDLSKVIENVTTLLFPLAEKRGLKLIFDSQIEHPINADERILKQVFINLINNAIKFTHEGQVEIKITANSAQYKIDVIDTGIGISKENIKAVFKDFYRGEIGFTANYEGTGLGLTLCRRLIKIHKGKIKVTSEVDKGSTFSVILPK